MKNYQGSFSSFSILGVFLFLFSKVCVAEKIRLNELLLNRRCIELLLHPDFLFPSLSPKLNNLFQCSHRGIFFFHILGIEILHFRLFELSPICAIGFVLFCCSSFVFLEFSGLFMVWILLIDFSILYSILYQIVAKLENSIIRKYFFGLKFNAHTQTINSLAIGDPNWVALSRERILSEIIV